MKEEHEHGRQQRIDITLADIAGYAEPTGFGYAYHAKWASHTGYHHIIMDSDINHEDVVSTGEGLYIQQKRFCYLVGDEHKEFGWKKIAINSTGFIQIRIPQWASETLKQALTYIGMKEECSLNSYWVFSEELEISHAKALLEPLLLPNTRFVDGTVLANAILNNYQSSQLFIKSHQLLLL